MSDETERPSPDAYKRAVVRAIAGAPCGLRELARKSGLAVATIHSYVKGPALPRLDHADRLARALGLEINALLPKEPPDHAGPAPNP